MKCFPIGWPVSLSLHAADQLQTGMETAKAFLLATGLRGCGTGARRRQRRRPAPTRPAGLEAAGVTCAAGGPETEMQHQRPETGRRAGWAAGSVARAASACMAACMVERTTATPVTMPVRHYAALAASCCPSHCVNSFLFLSSAGRTAANAATPPRLVRR